MKLADGILIYMLTIQLTNSSLPASQREAIIDSIAQLIETEQKRKYFNRKLIKLKGGDAT